MKKQWVASAGLLMCLGIGWIALRGEAQEKESDPVKLSPHMYQVRLENAYVRVLEYHSKPGEKEPMHFHPPGIVYALSDATIKLTDGQAHSEEHHFKTGEVSWRNKTWHASENTGATELHVVAIELKMPLNDLK